MLQECTHLLCVLLCVIGVVNLFTKRTIKSVGLGHSYAVKSVFSFKDQKALTRDRIDGQLRRKFLSFLASESMLKLTCTG